MMICRILFFLDFRHYLIDDVIKSDKSGLITLTYYILLLKRP